MFNSSNLASVPLVTNLDGCNNNGLFNGEGIWGLIIILAILGWGGNGFGFGGFGGNNAGGYSEIQRGFDNQAVISKLDGLTYGLSDSTYALNSSLMNGFHGVDNAVCNLGFNVQTGFNALSSQLAQCCCDNRAEIADVKYQMATQACDTRQAINTSTRDIIENANANNRALLDFLVNDKIATLQAENQSLKLSASQATQNSVLMAAMDANKAEILRRTGAECPTAAYIVQPPTPVTFPTNFSGQYGNCCGCGNF